MAFKNLTGLVFAVALSGCAGQPGWSLVLFPKDKAAPVTGQYSFAWRLSGDRAAGPLQVFDDGRNTWLQFAADQAIPAIFARHPDGDTPVAYRTDGAYIVLDQVWPLLRFRGGHLEAFAERIDGSGGGSHSAVAIPAAVPAPEPPSVAKETAVAASAARQAALAAPAPADHAGIAKSEVFIPGVTPPDTGQTYGLQPAVPGGSLDEAFTDSASVASPEPVFKVGPEDGNMRLALVRWAKRAGWTFQPEHWAVDVDIPVVGQASFVSGFEDAVQSLVGATEMAERPLQPCFYSNKVLRIIPYAQLCDRTARQEPA